MKENGEFFESRGYDVIFWDWVGPQKVLDIVQLKKNMRRFKDSDKCEKIVWK